MKQTTNGFDRKSDAQLLVIATSIASLCGGNVFFPTLQALVTLVATASTDFGTALEAAQTGDYVLVATKNQKRDELISLLRQLGSMVTGIAKGDAVMLASSGFPVRKQSQPTPDLTKPLTPALSNTVNAGEIKAVGSSARYAKTVFHMITADPITPASVWTKFMNTSRTYTFTALESGQRYWVKQGQSGVRSQYVESDAVSYVAQ